MEDVGEEKGGEEEEGVVKARAARGGGGGGLPLNREAKEGREVTHEWGKEWVFPSFPYPCGLINGRRTSSSSSSAPILSLFWVGGC